MPHSPVVTIDTDQQDEVATILNGEGKGIRRSACVGKVEVWADYIKRSALMPVSEMPMNQSIKAAAANVDQLSMNVVWDGKTQPMKRGRNAIRVTQFVKIRKLANKIPNMTCTSEDNMKLWRYLDYNEGTDSEESSGADDDQDDRM
ncbi:uncharacterized protein Dmoj_GI18312 [Drosophila mojavensis]|uniref:Uncharacterized protein n=1 Tax=Drosophila mojavensis TaxID=7230 RepID=B4LAT0_DROMO|nr:uncharacterized protein Dmoj_GI18312 [Drosophila mojavensis]